jgi:hypothetical protein
MLAAMKFPLHAPAWFVPFVTMILLTAGCSDKKEPETAPPAVEAEPQAETVEPSPAPATTPAMVEPDPAPAPAAPAPAKTETSKPEKAGTATQARFEGYAGRVAGSWEIRNLVAEPWHFALVTSADGSKLALGTGQAPLKTVSGKPLVNGGAYQFTLEKKEGDLWTLTVTD